MSDLLKQIADLPPEKRALLEMLLKEQGVEFAQPVGLGQIPAQPRQPVDGRLVFPVSFAQQRLWFLDQLEPGSPYYNLPTAVRLTGRLDVDALERTFSEIVRRHESLRTTFATQNGVPVQVIATAEGQGGAFSVPLVDLTHYPDDQREIEALRLAKEDARRPFDLQSGPLLRAALLRLGENEHIVLLNLHHIISDGWSMGVMVREIAVLYDAFSNHRPSPLPPLPLQYADFAVWQRGHLQGPVLQEQIDYWQKELKGLPPLLELPTDRPRPSIQTFSGDTLAFRLSPDLGKALKEYCHHKGMTQFIVLMAAFQALLHRYSGQEQLSVGTPIANRVRAEIEPLIGFFVNTLVIRGDFSGDPTFHELVQRVNSRSIEAHAHQDIPFEMVIEAVQPERNLSHSTLFQVMFVMQNEAAGSQPTGGLKLAPVDSHSGTSKFDLTLSVSEQGGQLAGAVEFNTELFDRATIDRMVLHFQVLLEGALSKPDQRVSALPLLTGWERHQLLEEWNRPTQTYPVDRTIHQWVEAQVEQHPDAIALTFEGQNFTYRDLNERANRLAHHLIKLGVGLEDLVGIYMERSPEIVVCILAILKAGAAYLPLDPAYPPDRLNFILADAQAPVLLTHSAMTGKLPGMPSREVFIDLEEPVIATESSENPRLAVEPENLAYVIYTSGSTGKPKGVMVTHANVVRLFAATDDWYHFTSQDVWTLFHSYAFDFSVWEIWGAFFYGGRLVVVPFMVSRSPEAFYQLLVQEQVTVLNQTPSAFRQLIRAEEVVGQSPSLALRLVIFGGEALELQSLRSWFERHGDTRPQLVNMYGITETTVHVTYRPIHFADLDNSLGSVIGCAIPDLQIYILDPHHQPAPAGLPGEMYVGGAGVSRGYLKRPELNAEKFISIPPHLLPAASSGSIDPNKFKLYRSGDLARYLPDGDIEYLGRIDHQVKIRGFRIELGEIESVLAQHPWVGEAAVIVREDTPGDKRLVAYLVSKRPAGTSPLPDLTGGAATLTTQELREFLRPHLPDYMIPAAFVVLPSIPLTNNGKVDRRALSSLPRPDVLEHNAAPYVPPSSPEEEIIAGIWAQVLGVERIGVTANFFDLGGHSLLATQIVSRLREAFNVELPLRSLFESPTVEGLARQVEAARQAGTVLQAPPLAPAARQGPLPLSFAQQRLWFLDQLEPGSIQYNIPSAYLIQGRLDVPALERSLNEMVHRHEALRTRFQYVDGGPVQVILPEVRLQAPCLDLRSLAPEERQAEADRIIKETSLQPFDLAAGPLLRVRLLRLEEEEHLILLTVHHIVSDGWSTVVMMRELAALYTACASGGEAGSVTQVLPELPIQYADFAVWQRAWLQGEVLEAHLDYWRKELQGLPPSLELPTDRPRPVMQTFAGDYRRFTLPAEISHRVKEVCRQEGVTLYMALLAAFQSVLHRYSGQDDLAVGTPIANRTRAEIEGLIGFFVNTLVIRADFSGDPTFRELLRQVRDRSLGAYAHQDVPFEMIVDALQPVRDTSHSPLFQVMFTLQNIPSGAQAASSLSIVPVETQSGTAKFDLNLTMSETGEQIEAALEYNTDLFDAATIDRLAGHFQVLLASALADPGQRVSALPLLGSAERHQVLLDWNDSRAPLPAGLCLHHLFESQVQRTPDRPAVRAAGRQLSYAELDRRANRVAVRLQDAGVKPDDLVGLLVERSVEMLVGLMGILKAGAAYLPLDTSYPPDRLAYIVEDSRAPVVLVQEKLLGQLSLGAARVFCLERDFNWDASGEDPHPQDVAGPENLAYVIYTSGSTGRPKGVMIEHHSAINLWVALRGEIWTRLGPGPHRVSMNAPLMFDASIQGWLMLLSGDTVCITPQEARLDGAAMLEWMEAEKLDVLDCVPTQLKLLLGAGLLEKGGWRPQAVLPGGEAIDAGLWANLAQAGEMEFYNMYGPTECAVDSTICRVKDVPGRPSIGRGVVNSQMLVLDTALQPVPVGVPGELWIGGEGVGRGYLNRPELTGEKFRPVPATLADAGIGSARIYRTGDLVRWLPDGNLEYLGRLDNQVKIRGFRVELGEIEASLAKHPALEQAAVIVREDTPGEKRLAAYFACPAGIPAPAAQELRDFLRQELPDYMVPGIFVALPALPLTSNAKVDRRALAALPRPEMVAAESDAYQAPRTPEEELIASVWAKVLGVAQVGVTANFFELGGDSILSIQAITRINQAGLSVSPRQLFENPTVAGLAAVAGRALAASVESGPVTGALQLTPIQRRFFELDLPVRDHWNQSLLLQVRQPVQREALAQAVRKLVEHHDAMRLRFQQGEAGWEGQFLPAGAIPDPLVWVDLAGMSVNEQAEAIPAHCSAQQRSLNIERGELFRIAYFDLGPDQPGRLFLAIHHLAVDAVSWRILLEDLQRAYLLAQAGQPIQLPAKTTSFQAWSQQLIEYALSEPVQAELPFWQAQLSGESGRLPVDFPGDPRQNTEESEEAVESFLDPEETRSLLQDVPPVYHTEINHALLAALALASARWTGNPALLVEMEGHGREDLFAGMSLTRTVGWFTIAYPVRLDLGSAQNHPGEALKLVKEQLRAVPRRGIGYGLLRYLTPTGSFLATLPGPEIAFNYLGQMDGGAENMLFDAASESKGSEHDPASARGRLVEVNGGIAGGRLGLKWSFSRRFHRAETVQRMAQDYLEALREIIAHCKSPEAGGFTPSDFPLANVDQKKLDKILKKVNRPGGRL